MEESVPPAGQKLDEEKREQLEQKEKAEHATGRDKAEAIEEAEASDRDT